MFRVARVWRRVSLGALCLVVAPLTVAALLAQEPAGILAEYSRSRAALAKKDYAGAARHLGRALELAPGHPGLMAELARAEWLNGQAAVAIPRLVRALGMGSGLDVIDDPAMASVLQGPEAAGVRKAADALRAPVATSTEAFRLAERDLIPEGIAYDPAARQFYVGSIYHRKIVRVDAGGRATPFVGEKQDGLLSVLGMKVDPVRRELWAATQGHLNMQDATPGEDGRAALMKYDLASGRLIKKYEPEGDAGRHLFNDVAFDGQGNVYVTDSEAGSVYVVRRADDRLERLVGPGQFAYPNGIALASDGRRLFVAHLGGTAIVEIATRTVSPLACEENVALTDIDGMYRDGHRLVVVQNGLAPARVAVLTLNAAEDRVTGATVLERGHALFAAIPTTGAVVDGWFYYIANAQIRAFGRDHRILPMDKLQEPVILKTRLPR